MGMNRRTSRVASLIQHELAAILLHEIEDPPLEGIGIHELELSPDLKKARVFYSHSGEIKRTEVLGALKRAMPFLRRRLAEKTELRYIPELNFEYDAHGESVSRLYHIFDSMEESRKGTPSPESKT